ncbi:MAG TPA: phage head closure protein [Candidatus Ornithocaccomicrobium faecavium]|uniref:Phage head closure protein n=1 Tax=Candidatus Ornithocaccomicrobium faecavium TaxID=2840890 RepID=A0A9D1TEM4_9FIRM|nr:phage head closure protein [Candidatus Ornithocaccomicrobium faecavium]
MKAGDLKHRITIERPEETTDERGNRRTVWRPIATCWASMADVSGRDFYAAQAYQAQDTVTFGIRWRDSIDRECRIVHAGQIYQIEQINHLGYKRDFMHIKTRLIRGEGV